MRIIYSFFKTVASGKPVASPKRIPLGFFKGICSACFEILRIFICLYSAITIILCVNYEEAKMIDAL